MAENHEQRICIKFCVKLENTSTETYDMIQKAFPDNSMSRSRVFEWYRRFKEGRNSVDSYSRLGRPLSSRNSEYILAVKDMIKVDRRLTIREISEDIGISLGSCQAILTNDLGLRRVAAKFVPRLLTSEQKDMRLETSKDLLNYCSDDDKFLCSIITGDESWVYGYDPETKVQSSVWKSPSSPRPTKARQVRSKIKVLLTVFFDSQGIIQHEYAPSGQTVTGAYYLNVLRHLRDAIRRKRPDMWTTGDWKLHHDNAPAHTSLLIQQFLAKFNITQVPHPPYSPDLAPCDFFIFPKIKFFLKGRRFDSISEIKQNATSELFSLQKKQFFECFQKWKQRWKKCVDSSGEYFEGL